MASIYATARPAATSAAATNVTSPGASQFPTTAKVEVGDNDGNMLPLKPEEKVAILFLTAIQQIENECQSGSSKLACTMAQVRTHLKFDPATDSSYNYTLGINGMAWEVRATAKKPGLLNFYFMQRSWPGSTLATFNRAAAAGAIDIEIGNRSIEGDSFVGR